MAGVIARAASDAATFVGGAALETDILRKKPEAGAAA
jgi:hypothetical protein